MPCTILVPYSRWPDPQSHAQLLRDLPLPVLQRLSGRGRQCRSAPVSPVAALADCCALPPFSETAVMLALDLPTAPPGYWVQVAPVSLLLGPDGMRLRSAALPHFDVADVAEWMTLLNGHFAAEGLQFIAPHPQRWYARLPAVPQVSLTALDQAIVQDITEALPQGKDALSWHRWLNEAQMLLAVAPQNAKRQAAGLDPINGLWFWGGTEWPQTPTPELFIRLVADWSLAVALGWRAGQTALPLSIGLPDGDEPILVVYDGLMSGFLNQDALSWRRGWLALEQNWLAPCLARLRTRKLDRLDLVFPEWGRRVVLTPTNLWYFWRADCWPFEFDI